MDENPSPAPGPTPIHHPLARLLDRLWPAPPARPVLLPAIALVPLLLAGQCQLDAPAPPAAGAAKLSHPTGKASPARRPHKQPSGEVIGRGWTRRCRTGDPLALHCSEVTTYQLDLPVGRRSSTTITVSRAVYRACGFGERYPRCAGAAS